jgi:hypothetical protein
MDIARRLLSPLLLAFAFALAADAVATPQPPHCCVAPRDANALRARFDALAPQLASSACGRPIHLESRETDNALKGEVYAVMRHPFAEVRDSLQRASSWCDVMLLPFNTKGCTAEPDALHVHIGRKKDTPLAEAFRVDFHYSVKARGEDYQDGGGVAPSGPLGTRDYRISLEAAPLDGGRTFLHLSYSYGFSMMSRVAMSAYLSTAGAEKVGFSRDAQGNYVRGVRGVIERNTMRYFLAIDAFLDSLAASPDVRVEKRIREWFAAAERYPRQLHEMDADEYVAMKRREYQRLAAR